MIPDKKGVLIEKDYRNINSKAEITRLITELELIKLDLLNIYGYYGE